VSMTRGRYDTPHPPSHLDRGLYRSTESH
jgi:hypothetical protein